ncbi:uncharacterized protein TNCV_2433231 [Trichonephila clavipes]|nr:uncharacterized protein TNCV_2433231 [Trichonephila clavipes]
MGSGSRRLTRVLLLKACHRAAPLAWEREHRKWSVENWERAAWSDESQFRVLNANGYGQVTWMTPELTPLLLTTTPHLREDVSALDKFSVNHCPTRLVVCGTGLEFVTRPATTRYLYHSTTTAT